MNPQDLLQHLRSEGDSTHTAISIYLVTLHSHVRQDPDVNSKKKTAFTERGKGGGEEGGGGGGSYRIRWQ
jgi:hypothetical protein